MKIHHRHTDAVIFESESASVSELVVEAVRLRADLSYANLSDANLSGSNLSDANLSDAGLAEQTKGAQ